MSDPADAIYHNATLCFQRGIGTLFEKLRESAVGTTCEITRWEHSWRFLFGNRCWIVVECQWRIICDNRIAVAGRDDGHQFGLPAPVDGQNLGNSLLSGSIVTDFTLDHTTADLTISFQNGCRIDVLNNSMGYEGWQAGVDTELGEGTIIGLGGGSTAELSPQNGR